jgi:hypothetical protein
MAKRGQSSTRCSDAPLRQVRSPSGEASAASHRLDDVHPIDNRRYSVESSATPDPIVPNLLSGVNVEQIFGRSARTLRRWEQRGHLTPVRVGCAKFFRSADIRRLVSGRLEDAMGKRAGPAKSRRGDPAQSIHSDTVKVL